RPRAALRCVSGDPGSCVAVDRSSLARDIAAVVDLGALAGSFIDHRLQDLVDAVGDILVDHSPTVGVGYVKIIAGTCCDLGNDDRITVDAAGGEGCVRPGRP